VSVLEQLPSPPQLGDDDRHGLADLLQAFSNLEFDDAMQLQLWTIVAAVLHLGNVTFVAASGLDVNEACAVDVSNPAAEAFCSLVGSSVQALNAAICTRVISIRAGAQGRTPPPKPGKRASTMLSPQQAAALGNAVGSSDVVKVVSLEDACRARDALAKILYVNSYLLHRRVFVTLCACTRVCLSWLRQKQTRCLAAAAVAMPSVLKANLGSACLTFSVLNFST